ncbi:hypothetical protein QF046_001117 [Microbacterium sp. W4I4]|uniref:hypothetical protein n=1 Tax=Microbacterium sp. W4I4 TaxID=3042295 RepID=UPI00278B1CA8|nr:hypothetical protein [Microbacterium sp. W4I4]MDQ0613476.1 hypothetical protein [Microbacterium sp. W4I4]
MSENSEAAAGESAPVPSPKKRGSTRLVVGVIVGVLVVAGAVTLVSVLAQPSAITRAGEACSGSKPLDVFLESLRETSSPQPTDQPTESDETGALDDVFAGVVSVEDDGTTLIINTAPKDDDPLGMTSLALECVYEQLDVPAHIRERIGATRSLDGRQDGTWSDYTASWSYHPDSGANLIVVQE